MEKTVAIIKPDAVKNRHVSEILDVIEKTPGLKIVGMSYMTFTPELAHSFYKEHRHAPFFKGLVEHMCSGPSVVLFLEGNEAVTQWRRMIGPTDPRKGQYGTHLRARYGSGMPNNGLHGSATTADGAYESLLINEHLTGNKSTNLRLNFKKLHEDAQLPTRATPGSVGLDLYCIEDCTLIQLQPQGVRTGLAVEVPAGFEGQVRTRSGRSLKGVVVANCPGAIDQDYRGELVVPMISFSRNFSFKKGDKIAQFILSPVDTRPPQFIDELSETTRGDRGFGHSG